MATLKAQIHELAQQTHGESVRSSDFKARKDRRQDQFEIERAKRKAAKAKENKS